MNRYIITAKSGTSSSSDVKDTNDRQIISGPIKATTPLAAWLECQIVDKRLHERVWDSVDIQEIVGEPLLIGDWDPEDVTDKKNTTKPFYTIRLYLGSSLFREFKQLPFDSNSDALTWSMFKILEEIEGYYEWAGYSKEVGEVKIAIDWFSIDYDNDGNEEGRHTWPSFGRKGRVVDGHIRWDD